MSLNTIKCPNCSEWNSFSGEASQRCSKCGALLDSRQANNKSKAAGTGFSFTDSLPPYARYVLLAIVAVVATIVVIAFA